MKISKQTGMHAMLCCQCQFLLVLSHHDDFTTAQAEHLRCQLANFAIAEDRHASGRLEMHLFYHLKVGGERLDKDCFLVTHFVRHEMEVLGGQGQVFRECSI